MDRIPVAGPSITRLEIDYVTDAVTNAWYGNANMYHARFESAFADVCGQEVRDGTPVGDFGDSSQPYGAWRRSGG